MNWISVKDRLPEDENRVLTTDRRGMGFAHYYKGCKGEPPDVSESAEWVEHFCLDAHITHWMPMPKPPEGP